ncbi:MAG: hydrogenase maturation protease [Candidatus Omnitrophica bacterium]|nr:hydrogenase maturation protease [Candidatus Omnitrophota bacterium]
MKPGRKVLLIGFGNPGRLDDGLGPALIDELEKKRIPDVSLDSNYQLNVEDAEHISRFDTVIFADASINCLEPFEFKELNPSKDITFTSHSISPQSVLALAQEMFSANTKGYIIEIRGYEFDSFGQEISPRAKDNLQKALEFISVKLSNQGFD